MRHISFDFWNTVAKPNPTYASERSTMLADIFGTSYHDAKANYAIVKNRLDAAGERDGLDYGRLHAIGALCDQFGKQPDVQFREQLGIELDRLFVSHPPTIDPELHDMIQRAYSRGITISIGSNTNFILGATIRDHVLAELPFSFFIFSDEIGLSKPDAGFFRIISVLAKSSNYTIDSEDDILHIGDDVVRDCQAAQTAGMRYARVEDADHTAGVLRGLL